MKKLVFAVVMGAALATGSYFVPEFTAVTYANDDVYFEDYILECPWVQCNGCGEVLPGTPRDEYGHLQVCTNPRT